MNKLNKTKKIVPVLLAGILVFTGAAAWLSTSDTADETQKIQAGTFEIVFNSESNAILDEAAYPVSEAVGLQKDAYLFTVENTGTINQMVRLGLSAEAAGEDHVELPANLIQVRIYNEADGSEVYSGTLEDIENAEHGAGEVLPIDGGAKINYSLKAWIDESAVNEDLYGVNGDEVRSIKFTILANGIQRDGGLFEADETNLTFEEQWDAAAGQAY